MKLNKCLFAAALVAATLNSAWAKDAVQASVSNPSGAPIIQNNGNPDAQGTYAVGTIHVTYTVVGYEFPTGYFADLDIDWGIATGYSSGGTTSYANPILLELEQVGGSSLELHPSPDSFQISSNADSGSSHVQVVIADNVAGDADLNCDGCALVGKLRLSTDPAGAKLDTVTDVLVKLVLVHPDACLKAYNFITSQDDPTPLSSTKLTIPTNGSKKGTVTGSTPGQYSDNVLIANTCPQAERFHLYVDLDPNFETNPSNNAGNAVFTYASDGEVDLNSFDLASFGTGTPQGQKLCLTNLAVAADTSLLVTVHSQIVKGTQMSSLPDDRSFDFKAALYDATNTECSGTMHPSVTPNNPVTTELKYTY